MRTLKAEEVLEGFVFTESPRWHGNALWFVDMGGWAVFRYEPGGHLETIIDGLDDEPGGLGFLPDGTPLVVMKYRQEVCRIEAGKLVPHASLKSFGDHHQNDMIVGPTGRAYVGSTNSHRFKLEGVEDHIILVEPDGTTKLATREILNVNGMVISADGRTLTASQTWLSQLTSGTIQDDGTLTDIRLEAHLNYSPADGLCGDEAGGFWVAGMDRGFFRVLPGGEVTDRVPIGERLAMACVLGGADRRTLFMMTTSLEGKLAPQRRAPTDTKAFVEVAEVEIPGAGTP